MPNSIKAILKKDAQYAVNGRLWIEFAGERVFGPGPVELLMHIEKTGSLSQAAKNMAMSYKKAWNILAALNTKFAKPLVLMQTGGKHGGGSVLTPEAKALMAYHQRLRSRFMRFMEQETRKLLRS